MFRSQPPKKLWKIILNYIVDFSVISLCIFPLSYSIGRSYSTAIALFVGFICASYGIKRRRHVVSVILSIIAGFIINFVIWGIFKTRLGYWNTLQISFLASFCFIFAVGILPYSIGVFAEKGIIKKIDKHVSEIVVIIAILASLLSALTIILNRFHIVVPILHTPIVHGILYGLATGTLYSIFIRHWLLPSAYLFGVLLEYMRAMILPVSAFLIGYLIIILIFAGLFGIIDLFDPIAFKGLHHGWHFGSFIYYSLISIATVGYGDILPRAPIARFLVGVEVLVGLLWTTMVLAAIIAYMEETLDALRKCLTHKPDKEGYSLRGLANRYLRWLGPSKD